MIIVFGSNVLDLFFDTADLPKRDTALFLDSHHEEPGGKGANQAVAAARAGSEVRFFGALGKGGHGRQMHENLLANKVDASGVQFLECPSGLATIFVDERDGTHKVVVSQGANLLARQDTVPDAVLTKDATLLLQGELPMEQTAALMRRAKQKGARIIMNLAPVKPLTEQILNDLDIIVVNEHEADALGKQFGVPTTDKEAFARNMLSKYSLVTIVTLGPDGAVTVTKDGTIRVPTLKITPVDAIGAGDAFCGYLAAGLDQGKSLVDSMRQASVAGALTCTKVGAQTALPHANEVSARIKEIVVADAGPKKAAV